MTARTRTQPDYYAILGIPAAAALADIKRAYRRLARQYHPDTNPDKDAARRFRQITEAYELLSDQARRQAYDATRPPTPGPPATPDNSAVVSRLLAVLEDAWTAIRRHHPQIPPVVIIIGSGSTGRHRLYGYHDPARWRVAEGDRAEIMISGEGLTREPADVLGTLLHEAAHALAASRGIKDTSRQGRYHNQKYKTLAGELGITVEHDDRLGWSTTNVPETTARTYAVQIAALAEAMTLWRHAEHHAANGGNGTGGGRSTNLLAACCPCGRSIRIAASTLAAAPVICAACDGKFEAKEPR
jgi:curved DNA-binding protein CbpA